MTGAAEVLQAPSPVCIGHYAEVLANIARPGVQLAARQRGPDPAWAGWLAGLPAARLQAVTGDACRRWHRDCVPLPPPGLHRPGTRHPVGAADPRRCRVGPT